MTIPFLPNWAKRLIELIAIAAAYCVVGRLGVLLAIPPGYASAVWPASGIALAGILLFGYRVWPGILLGSFLINAWTPLDTTSAASILKSIWLVTSIGMGASLQAIVGALLIRTFLRYPTALVEVKEVIKFLVLGGPVSCLVNSTWSVTSLLLAGVIQLVDYPFHWWTWWLGDAVGVVTFTPLILIWAGKPLGVSLRRQISISVPLCLAFALVAIFFVYTSMWEQNRIDLEFDRRTDNLAQAVKENFGDYIDVLHSIESFYASSVDVDRHEFKSFVSRLLLRHPGIQALSWNPRLLDGERTTYEQAARRDGFTSFQITEENPQGQLVRAARRSEYVSVYYIEPHAGNESAMGFDVASDPIRREALNRARDTGKPTATDPIILVQDIKREWGFLVFLPIYRHGLPQNTQAERRLSLQGYVTGVFRISDMIMASLKGTDAKGIEVRLYDGTGGERKSLLYDHRSQAVGSKALPVETDQLMKPIVLQKAIPFEVAERRWVIQFAPTKEYLVAQRSWQAWSVLAGGLLFTALLGAFLLVVTGHAAELQAVNRELQREITERNLAGASLRESEARKGAILESALDCVITIDHEGKIVEFNPAAEKTFGYTRGQVIGNSMSELIIPPSLRERHRRGLAHYLSTGEGPALEKRNEMTAMRADGTEFPVELAITRIPMDGPPVFTGYLRDITERKQAEEEIQRNLGRMRALHEIDMAITSTLELRAMLNLLLEKIDLVLPNAVTTIRLINKETGELEPIACRNIEETSWRADIRKNSSGLAKIVLEHKIPLTIANIQTDPRSTTHRFARRFGLVSYLGVPLIAKDEVLGLIAFFTREAHSFHDEEIDFLTTLAGQSAVAIQNANLYAETKRRAGEISALHNLTAGATQSLDLDVVLKEAIKKITEIFHFDATRLYLFNELTDAVHLKASFEVKPWPRSPVEVTPTGEGLVGRVAKTGEMVILEDIQTDPRYQQLSQSGGAKKAGVRFFAAFPIQSKLKSWGALACIGQESRRLSVEEIDLLITLCNHVAIAIENATLFQQTAEKAKELSALYSVAASSAEVLDINALLYQSMRKVLDIFGFTAARIYIVDNEKQEIRLAAQDGFPGNITSPSSYRLGEGLVGRVIETGLPLTFEDMQSDPEYHQLAQTKIMLKAGFRASFFIPLRVRGETLGVMNLVSKEPHTFSPSDIQLINSIAYHLGVAIGNANIFSQLTQKTLDLEKANKGKDEFLSVMSHELRTPLNVIKGYTQLLREKVLGDINPEQERALEKITVQSRDLVSIVDDVLRVTIIEADAAKVESCEVNLRDILDELRSSYDVPVGKNLALNWDYSSELPVVNTDGEKLKTVLRNLVNNAIKFTENGSVTISVRRVPEADMVEFKIADTGIGISKENIGSIFDMFQQVDSSATRKYGGVGLGLYIVKKFTELLRGRVDVKSELSKGTCFTVKIPTSEASLCLHASEGLQKDLSLRQL